MATYAIGDVQGCFETLMTLLERVDFEPSRDRVWFAGDLVNRGPRSADVLRWCRDHDTRVTAVLGNHDLHLLARAYGGAEAKNKDTIDDVFAAPDREELLTWLRGRPAAHAEDGFLMVHAGLLPAWDAGDAAVLSRSIQDAMHDDDFLPRLGVRHPSTWSDDLAGHDRDEAALRILCNLRVCDPEGQPVFDFNGPPDEAPRGRIPWHAFPGRRPFGATVVCGHWAAQGLLVGDDLIALDTGAVWGNTLTAVELGSRAVTSVPLADTIPN